MEKKISLFKTTQNNLYLHSAANNQFLICHPILYYLINNNINKFSSKTLNQYLSNYEGSVYSVENLKYYKNKLKLLQKAGYFKNKGSYNNLQARLTDSVVKLSFANTPQICFEITEDCNLKCKYCAYGELYHKCEDKTRSNKKLEFNNTKLFLEYFFSQRMLLNKSYKSTLYIGFYGGEPLLNVPFIKDIINYLTNLSNEYGYKFGYLMTTNGVNLKKNIEFIVKHNFLLTISLDGDEINNQYRILKNGKNSYNTVLNNILYIKNNYNDYFNTNVRFNAVLHDKNTIEDLMMFFKKTFNKIPSIGEMSKFAVKVTSKNCII